VDCRRIGDYGGRVDVGRRPPPDRRQPGQRLRIRLFFRFALAAQMFSFGMAKLISTQFPPPPLVTLVKPVGDLAPDDLLWTFMGASVTYQMFTGLAEPPTIAGATMS